VLLGLVAVLLLLLVVILVLDHALIEELSKPTFHLSHLLLLFCCCFFFFLMSNDVCMYVRGLHDAVLFWSCLSFLFVFLAPGCRVCSACNIAGQFFFPYRIECVSFVVVVMMLGSGP
jgi:hypothetical protein